MISKSGYNRRKKQGLLHLSSMADHGFLLMIRLADASGAKTSLRAIAEEDGVSFFFLQKVALELRKAGLITADRGKSGGYRPVKSPSKTSIREILEALEGPLALTECLNTGGRTCARSGTCRLRPGFNLINDIIVKALSKKSLNDLIKAYEQS